MTRLIRIGLMLVGVMTLLSACSKTVEWEEEVPLNTGEVIWVKRIVTYKLQGDSGNPLDMAYRPDWTETLSFEWKNKTYSYTGQAHLMILAVSPVSKSPILVARADAKEWHWRNRYSCTNPFYVQFMPDESGQKWTWPPTIERWLYDMPYNLMSYRPRWGLDDLREKYTIKDRQSLDQFTETRNLNSMRVNPQHRSDPATCFVY